MSEIAGRASSLWTPREIIIKALRDEYSRLERDKIAFSMRARRYPHPDNQTWLDAVAIVAYNQKIIEIEVEHLENKTDISFDLERLKCT